MDSSRRAALQGRLPCWAKRGPRARGKGDTPVGLLFKLNLILVAVFILTLILVGYVFHDLLTDNAREQVLGDARLMMQMALAMRGYTSKQVGPALREREKPDEFLPQT